MTDAFTATPPEITIRGTKQTPRPLSTSLSKLGAAVASLPEAEQPGALLLVYAITHTLSPKEHVALLKNESALSEAIEEAQAEIPVEDVAKLDEYLSGVIGRLRAAQFIVDPTVPPGKPEESETSPTP